MRILRQMNGDQQGREYVLLNQENFLGRADSCDIRINESGISRRHAKMTKLESGSMLVEDCVSTNGTFINGVKILKSKIVDHGDEIRLGPIIFTYIDQNEHFKESDDSVDISSIHEQHSSGNQDPLMQTILQTGNFPLTAPQEKEIRELLKEEQKRLALLVEIGKLICSKLKLGELLDLVNDLVSRVLICDTCCIFLHDKDKGKLELKAIKKDAPAEDLFVSQTILNHVAQNRVSVLFSDNDDKVFNSKSIAILHIKSAMCVPLLLQDSTLVGIIYVDSKKASRIFFKGDLELLSGIAGQVAIAIENAYLFESIQKEVRYRNNLQRFLGPNLVDRILQEEQISLGGTSRNVTILFCDIRNFTGMTADRDSGSVFEQLNEYFGVMTKAIFKCHGTLDKYIGDGLMAIFGAPLELEDHPFWAIQAALEMNRNLKVLNDQWKIEGKPTFEVGIGICSGETMVGNIGSNERMDYTAIGSPVNLASRIEGLTKKADCNILISESTYMCVKDRVNTKSYKPVPVKGFSEPIAVYGLLDQPVSGN